MKNLVGKLYIKKRTASEWLIMFVFFLPFVQAFISELLGVPDIIKFLADVALVFLFVKMLLINRGCMKIRNVFYPFLILVGVFFAYVTITYFLNYQSIFYFIWGMRNYFRFFIAFVAYVFFLKWNDIQQWFKVLEFFYIINFFVMGIQFFMGYRQDFLGGIFGVQKGCNGALLIFFTVIVTKSVLEFMRGEASTVKCILFCIMALFGSALSELKFFFVLFVIISIIAAVMTRNSVKKTLFFVIGGLMVVVFSTILALMYDEFAGFMSLRNLWNALINPNYATKEDIGRITAIPIISERFLTGFSDKLFGMGLGNADSSSLGIFNTPFFDTYSSIHYSFFTYAFLFLETGIIGLVLYISFFFISFAVAFRLYKIKAADETICQIAMIFSLVCIGLMFYNVSLRSETSAYLAFFVLALPLISSNAVKSGKD